MTILFTAFAVGLLLASLKFNVLAALAATALFAGAAFGFGLIRGSEIWVSLLLSAATGTVLHVGYLVGQAFLPSRN